MPFELFENSNRKNHVQPDKDATTDEIEQRHVEEEETLIDIRSCL